MTAFNDRLRPKRVLGIPIHSALFLVMALPLAALGVLMDVHVLSFLLLAAACASFIAALVFFVIGDEAPFLRVYWLAFRENRNVTGETRTLH